MKNHLLLQRLLVLPFVSDPNSLQLLGCARANDLDEDGLISTETLNRNRSCSSVALVNELLHLKSCSPHAAYLHSLLQLLDVIVQRCLHKCEDYSLEVAAELLVQSADDVLAIFDFVWLTKLNTGKTSNG